ncbi:MAG TPA: class I SAM-dependent methyltransferase [Bryobacteraceae bacterium]|jgi:demethylmenaquinone methyltransferase/2-methoxy-6-polyprenyl-1,4-benzoquinol methylase|nr:class I SAM-dependent methyltransferase [Bryobacteraceae bacterium]
MTEAERIYYDRRAPEYDDWYLGTGLFAARERPGWHAEVEELLGCLRWLSPGPVLDVACGTGFLTRHVPGRVVALDQSMAMLRIARARLPGGRVVEGDALGLPFRAATFGCLLAAHFYGHLDRPLRARFLTEARRVAERILVVDAAWREGVQPEEVQERVLTDGSRHQVYKRYFTPAQLTAEIGGGRVVHAGRWFVAVMA